MQDFIVRHTFIRPPTDTMSHHLHATLHSSHTTHNNIISYNQRQASSSAHIVRNYKLPHHGSSEFAVCGPLHRHHGSSKRYDIVPYNHAKSTGITQLYNVGINSWGGPAIGDLMLKDTNDAQGYKEVLIYYSNGIIAPTWGGICGTTSDDYDGTVVCRQLGYINGAAKAAR